MNSYRIRIIFKDLFFIHRRENLTGTTTPGQSEDGVLHTPQIFRTGASLYFLQITGRHKALSFVGKGKGAVLQ